ncbi:MAG: FAD-dependent oxidoreductase [Candidatus Paceibacterota bacterium]
MVKHETVTFDKVLVAIGRVPNLPEGLEEAGISYDKRGVKIDSQYRTANRYVFAVGDVSQNP